jgi:hypothetical protein
VTLIAIFVLGAFALMILVEVGLHRLTADRIDRQLRRIYRRLN